MFFNGSFHLRHGNWLERSAWRSLGSFWCWPGIHGPWRALADLIWDDIDQVLGLTFWSVNPWYWQDVGSSGTRLDNIRTGIKSTQSIIFDMEIATRENSNGWGQPGINELLCRPLTPSAVVSFRAHEGTQIPDYSDVYNKTKKQEVAWWKKKLYDLWPGLSKLCKNFYRF